MVGLSKTEVNLKRLLAVAPHQQNQAKLIHYVATLREQLEQLAEEKTNDKLPRVSKVTGNEYSEKIEAVAARLAVRKVESSVEGSQAHFVETSLSGTPKAGDNIHGAEGLRRRFMPASPVADGSRDTFKDEQPAPIKLDAATQLHIQKHRKLQEDLTDEMVDLARQLKESSIVMSRSVKNTERLLDSTEKAVEHSLAITGHASTRAMELYSRSCKTSCFTWLLILAMTCIFIMVVLLIRIT